MAAFTPLNPDYEVRLRDSFKSQAVMRTLGAELGEVRPGETSVILPFREDLCQQHGFLHAGIVTTIVDNACAGAALSLMPPEAGVLSVEFKINLLAPAKGERFVARGWVVKPGRTIMVCQGEVTAIDGGQEKPVATMLATMMVVTGRPGIVG